MKYASTINPFYAARQYRPASELPTAPYQPILVRLPRVPVNASPVPTLTSLYHNHRAGEYGDRGYPGNCGGNLIRDLLLYFGSKKVLDLLCCALHKWETIATARHGSCPSRTIQSGSPLNAG
jgi:hypothetical protein